MRRLTTRAVTLILLGGASAILLTIPGSAMASKAVPRGYYLCYNAQAIRDARANVRVASVLTPTHFVPHYVNGRDENYCADVSRVLEYWLMEPWRRETAEAEASYWEALPPSAKDSATAPTVPPGVRPPATIPDAFHLGFPAGSLLFIERPQTEEDELLGRSGNEVRPPTPAELAAYAFNCRRFYGALWSCAHNKHYGFIFELLEHQPEAPKEFWHGGPPLGGVKFERQECSESALVPAISGGCPRDTSH